MSAKTPRSAHVRYPVAVRAARRLALVLVALFAVAGLAVAARPWLAPAPPAPAASVIGELEGEVITIFPTGFNPSEITRPAGPFFLAVHNRSGIFQTSLRVESPAGSTVIEAQLPPDQLDWNGVVTLPPGTYVLTELNQGWTCHITITP